MNEELLKSLVGLNRAEAEAQLKAEELAVVVHKEGAVKGAQVLPPETVELVVGEDDVVLEANGPKEHEEKLKHEEEAVLEKKKAKEKKEKANKDGKVHKGGKGKKGVAAEDEVEQTVVVNDNNVHLEDMNQKAINSLAGEDNKVNVAHENGGLLDENKEKDGTNSTTVAKATVPEKKEIVVKTKKTK